MRQFGCIANTDCARIPRHRDAGDNLRHGGAGLLGIPIPNHRRQRSKRKCGVVDVRYGLADDVEEFSHETEVVSDSIEKRADVNGSLNLTLS